MKRLIIVHGMNGSSQDALIKWLGKVGAEAGFEVTTLDMPIPEVPTIDNWVKHLDENVYYVDQDTYFIGWSIGCQAILRYLDANKSSKLGGAIFIGPFLVSVNAKNTEEQDIFRPWLERPIDFAGIRSMGGKITVVMSDNDDRVPIQENKDAIEKALQPKIIIEHNKGHFRERDGVTEIPVIIEELNSFK